MDALAAAHDAAAQMIDTSVVRVHQHGASISRNKRQAMGRSRGGLTSKVHAIIQLASIRLWLRVNEYTPLIRDLETLDGPAMLPQLHAFNRQGCLVRQVEALRLLGASTTNALASELIDRKAR